MRITSKGQVTIPAEIRERAGLLPQTEVDFEFDGTVVRIVRAAAGKKGGRGARLVAQLRGRGDVAMSTDGIMVLDSRRLNDGRIDRRQRPSRRHDGRRTLVCVGGGSQQPAADRYRLSSIRSFMPKFNSIFAN